ncbi:MAG: glycosyltransferase family 4 protein [Flavobacterium sp.]|uniref:glycosyltransferase family 4 protein n=1 Tax=Flavobacterium sp. TaxID=239 RepID=UPI003266C14A
MMQPKKIAIYSGEIPSTTFIERLIEGLSNNGCKILLFGLQAKKVTYPKNVSIFSYSNKWNKLFILLKYSFLLSIFKPREKKKLDKIICNKKRNTTLYKVKYYPVLYHKPDIFHLQWAKSLEDWIWVRDFGIKLILSLRGTHITISPIADEKLATQYRGLFPKVDGFHAVSKSIKKQAEEYGAEADKIKVIYSGLHLKEVLFVENKIKNRTLKILSIGRSHWVKGYTDALDACALLKKENFDFQYSIIGVGSDEELIFQRVQLDLEEEVTFKKSMPFKEIITEIQQADILLLSSLEEGIANVVLEAMALGTIVLSTNCGGIEEVITDGENGFIIPVRNPKLIVEKIKLIALLSENNKIEIRKKARETIEKQHGFLENCKGMQALYQSVLITN